MSQDQNQHSVNDNLWGPVMLNNWQTVLYIKNKIATEQDVIDGKAVFYIGNCDGEHNALNIPIPSTAYHIDNETSEKKLVIVIQAEKANDQEVIGIRYFDGGNGICLLGELEFITE